MLAVGTRVRYHHNGTDFLGRVCRDEDTAIERGEPYVAYDNPNHVPVRLDKFLPDQDHYLCWRCFIRMVTPAVVYKVVGNELVMEEQ